VSADFVLDEMPGDTLHALLRACREAGPIVSTRFMGLDARVIAGHDALDEAFRDEATFPGHRMYQASFEPAIGASFISDPDPVSHLRTRKLATPAFRSRAVSRFAAEGIAPLAHELLDDLLVRDVAGPFGGVGAPLACAGQREVRVAGSADALEGAHEREEVHARALVALDERHAESPAELPEALAGQAQMLEFVHQVVLAHETEPAPETDVKRGEGS